MLRLIIIIFSSNVNPNRNKDSPYVTRGAHIVEKEIYHITQGAKFEINEKNLIMQVTDK